MPRVGIKVMDKLIDISKVKQHFLELGYKIETFDNIISFYKPLDTYSDVCISFNLTNKTVTKYKDGFPADITALELKAIYLVYEEMGWFDADN